MNNIKKKYLVVALLTLSMSTTAQIEKNEWGFPKTYIPDLRQNSRVTTSVFFNDVLHVGLEDNFKVEELRSIDPKMRNMKYEQYYKGLKVMGCGYTIHCKDGFITWAHGNYVPIDDLNTTPSITEKDAVCRLAHKEGLDFASTSEYETKLFVRPPQKRNEEFEEEARLVYQVFLPLSEIIGYVDAHNGEVISAFPSSSHVASTGTLYTLYSGMRQSTTNYNGGKFYLEDTTRGDGIYTWNLNGNSTSLWRVELEDDNNIWTIAEHQTNNLYLAHDVQWGMQATYDYLYNNHGISSFDGNGHSLHGNINYDSTRVDHAAWNSPELGFVFSKRSSVAKPLVSLDVIAHEFGHAVGYAKIEWTAFNDSYDSLSVDEKIEVQGCAEGFSDIWGIIVESSVKGSSNRWKLAEECFEDNANYNCLRNVESPASTHAYVKTADTYNGPRYDFTDSHIKGGVFSRWFYLLANGGSGINGIGNSYNVVGLGFSAAESLFVDAIFSGCLGGCNGYLALRNAFKQYAIDNLSSFDVQQIENAWYAVGVGSRPSQISISGSSVLCSTNTYSISGLLPCHSVTWSLTGGNTSSVSLSPNTPSANQCTLTVSNLNTFNSVTLTAEIKLFGTTVGTISKQITKSAGFSGTYEETSILYNGSFTPSIPLTAIPGSREMDVYVGGLVKVKSDYFSGKSISISGPYTNYYRSGSLVRFTLSSWSGAPVVITVQAEGCDDEVQLKFFPAVMLDDYSLNISPDGNSTYALSLIRKTEDGVLPETSSAADDCAAPRLFSKPWTLEVTNALTGRKAFSKEVAEPSFLLHTDGWEAGVYVVRALVGDASLAGKITVK